MVLVFIVGECGHRGMSPRRHPRSTPGQLRDQLPHVLDAVGRLPQVHHGVAVRADGAKVGNGIDVVVLADIGQGHEVMDVDEAGP